MTDPVSGLLLLDKPEGVTSFDCVRLAKRRFLAARAGHCGTLDPSARGLLLILLGQSTRLQDSFLGLEKEYWFRGQFGIKTSTADREGHVVEERPFHHVTQDALTTMLESFVGEIEQTPPLYSALKFKGKPYYHYARKGQDVPRVPRKISIASITLLSLELPYWEARVVCSRGTYVRTLVEDIAERLGACATLAALSRERIGSYRKDQALSWDALRAAESDVLNMALRPATAVGEPIHV